MVVRWAVTKGDVNGSRKVGVSRLVFQNLMEGKSANGNLLHEVVAEIRIRRSPVVVMSLTSCFGAYIFVELALAYSSVKIGCRVISPSTVLWLLRTVR
jgi:hypothetical protein